MTNVRLGRLRRLGYSDGGDDGGKGRELFGGWFSLDHGEHGSNGFGC